MAIQSRAGGLVLYRMGDEQAVRFAAKELSRYLTLMTGRRVRALPSARYDPRERGIWVGVAEHFGSAVPKALRSSRDLFDDGIFVRADNGHAVVSGANPRSVVFAAYRFLEELGCRWFRPGPGGEAIPKVPYSLEKPLRAAERPSARHRCICIEGSCAFEHVRDMIDYAAKRGFNAYYFQFRDAFPFFNTWYAHERPGQRDGRDLTPRETMKICNRAKQEAIKRGMILHSVGHGWTTQPFGIPPNRWGPGKRLSPSIRKYFAMMDGKRGMNPKSAWVGYLPLITNLCYSNPEVRSILAREVVRYAASHPHEQVIHFWLADGSNNNCECENCEKARPSDFYVQILNEIDERLAEEGLPTRIVFLAYVDLLWAPQRNRILNPDRFILMFAPITRSYATGFLEKPSGAPEAVMPFRRNRLVFPRSPQANLELLSGWRRKFKGECVDFDYHLWSRSLPDPALMQISKVLFKDVRDLRKLGMDGFISCQLQRVAFPTGIALHLMGKALWNRRARYDETVDEYFTDLFGKHGSRVRGYLEELSRLFDSEVLRGEKTGDEAQEEAKRKWRSIPSHVRRFRPVIRRALAEENGFRALAWRILDDHAWYSSACAEFLAQVADRNEAALDTYIRIEKELRRRRSRLTPVLDISAALRFLRRRLLGRR